MFLRCFRVDRIFRSINQYIVDTMDEFFIMPPVVSFSAIYDQTTCNIPVVFILSAGSDPTNDLMKLAEQVGGGLGNFCHISLGQGQEKVKYNTTPHHNTVQYSISKQFEAISHLQYMNINSSSIFFSCLLHFFLSTQSQ